MFCSNSSQARQKVASTRIMLVFVKISFQIHKTFTIYLLLCIVISFSFCWDSKQAKNTHIAHLIKLDQIEKSHLTREWVREETGRKFELEKTENLLTWLRQKAGRGKSGSKYKIYGTKLPRKHSLLLLFMKTLPFFALICLHRNGKSHVCRLLLPTFILNDVLASGGNFFCSFSHLLLEKSLRKIWSKCISKTQASTDFINSQTLKRSQLKFFIFFRSICLQNVKHFELWCYWVRVL